MVFFLIRHFYSEPKVIKRGGGWQSTCNGARELSIATTGCLIKWTSMRNKLITIMPDAQLGVCMLLVHYGGDYHSLNMM